MIAQAQACTGIEEKTALVREALKALIEREAARRLAPARLQPGVTIWTRDRRLKNVADELNLGAMPGH